MSTFSQIIDELVIEHIRPDLLPSITDYLNQTIRELHSRRQTAAPILFESNRVELEWTTAAQPAIWTIPNVPRFQRFETAYYYERGVYALKRHPSRAFERGVNSWDPYWYRAGQNIVFNGIGIGETIKQTYFEFPARLAYYASALRPATYNIETDSFTYLPSYDVDDTTRLAAQNLVTNWLLLRWAVVLKQGVRAKIFARLGEETRAKMGFSAFESQREGLNSAESFEDNQ